jgi:hypothetical protein
MMEELLLRIKRAVLAGRYVLTTKANGELDADGLLSSDIVEAIVTAVRIQKSI